MSGTRDFLRTVRPPYFDAFYFIDEAAEPVSRIVPHSFFKIIFYLEGDVYYMIENQRYDLVPGDILIAPRLVPYSSHSPGRAAYRRLAFWFSGDLLDSIDPDGELRRFFERIDETKKGACFHFAHSYQNEIFRQALHLVSERDYSKPFGDTVSHSIASLVLVGIYRAVISSRSEETEDSETNQLVDDVVDYINANLLSDLSLDMIAETFFISKFHLERIFKKKMSITVHNYIIQRRLTLARQKLYDGASPTRIYKMCGFANYSTFYRAFQKMYNITPKQFSEQAASIMFFEGDRGWNAWGSREES